MIFLTVPADTIDRKLGGIYVLEDDQLRMHDLAVSSPDLRDVTAWGTDELLIDRTQSYDISVGL